MSSYALLTNTGRNKEAAALANGTALSIAEIAWGDGNYAPSGGEIALVNELGRKPVQDQGLPDGALNTAYFEILLTEAEGPFVIHEAGLFDDDGDLIAIVKYDPPVNKPKDTVSAILRINVVFSDLENLILKIDATTAFVPAIRKVDTGNGLTGGGSLENDLLIDLDMVALSTLLLAGGFISNAALATAIANFVTQTQLDAAIATLVGASPAALDTLNELAAALGDDPNFATTMTALIGTKLNADAFTSAAILALLLSVDGVGSGLDADLLDGKHASEFTTPADLNAAISDLVAASPGTLDTLNELAAALGDDPNFAATMTALIGTKLDKSGGTIAGALIMSGGSVYVNASGPTGNAHYWLRDENGVSRALIYWSRTVDALRMMKYAPDGVTVEAQLNIFADRAEYNGKKVLVAGEEIEPDYTSPIVAYPAANTPLTVAHGLSATPKQWNAYMTCITAEFGYEVGDTIQIAASEGANPRSTTVWATVTALGIIRQNNMFITRRDAAGNIAFTPANWNVFFRAWK